MNTPFLISPSSNQSGFEPGEEKPGVNRRQFLKRTGGATVATIVLAATFSQQADAHEPIGSGSWRLRCTGPEEGLTSGDIPILAGAPATGGNTHVLAQEYSTDWITDPGNANVQSKWFFWGYLTSRIKDDNEKKTKDTPSFTAGGRFALQSRARNGEGEPWGGAEWLSWNSETEDWEMPLEPVTTIADLKANLAMLRTCPPHTRNGCIAINRADGSFVPTTHGLGGATSLTVGGLRTTINIEGNGSSMNAKAKFLTPVQEFGETTILVEYTAVT